MKLYITIFFLIVFVESMKLPLDALNEDIFKKSLLNLNELVKEDMENTLVYFFKNNLLKSFLRQMMYLIFIF